MVLLFSAALSVCSTSIKYCNPTRDNWEGYIFLSFQFFNDIDDNGVPVKPAKENINGLLTGGRKMYLYHDRLIDIIGNKNFVNGKYKWTDTGSYNFYDLTTQEFIDFDNLSAEAKILKRGKMSEGGSFSNLAEFDPMHGVPDSIWKVTDTIINGKKIGVVNFIYSDTTDRLGIEIAKRSKFWVDYSIKSFPLQLSYILSKKLNNAFVYKMQQSAPDGKAVLITTLAYEPVKLPDSLIQIFKSWAQVQKKKF